MERVDLPILDKLDGTGLLYEIFEKIWNINTIAHNATACESTIFVIERNATVPKKIPIIEINNNSLDCNIIVCIILYFPAKIPSI